MTEQGFDYEGLVQDALRGVVRDVLLRVAEDGLPGDHHFFIGFRTDHPEVAMASDLRSRYPEEMRIVLQSQFWNLLVEDQSFSVDLRFGGVPHTLTVPFTAITTFFDPSVPFGLGFQQEDDDSPDNDGEGRGPRAAEEPPASTAGAEVVSFDAFRRRT